MTNIQRKKLDHLFQMLDVDGSGTLEMQDFELVGKNLSDILGYLEESSERSELVQKSQSIFSLILSDIGLKKTTIQRKEWITFFKEVVYTRANDYINLASTYLFSLFDLDGDGYIDEREYLNMFRVYGLYTSNAKKTFDELDRNRDGRISGGELVVALEDFFYSTDSDRPGNWIFGDWTL